MARGGACGGLSTLLSGRIRLFTASQPPCCSHTRSFFFFFLGPKVPCGISGGSCPSRRQGGTQGAGCSWTRGGQDPHGWVAGPGRWCPLGREGQWKLSCWRPFALLYPKSTKGSLQRAVHASSQPLGGPALPRGCASKPSPGAGDCCRTGDMAMPTVAAGACDIAMGFHEDVVALMWSLMFLLSGRREERWQEA